MRRILWSLTALAAALMAAVGVYVLATLPPRALTPTSSARDSRLVWGAYHVHSNRSDGSGSPDEIAAAAASAGLHFVVLTDHGDATELHPPEYRHGVLCVYAAEVSTEGGHVVALNLQQPSAYPLAGEARDVIEDIHRLGGWAVAAHPESPRPALRWRTSTPVDGYEWLNADSEWRGHSPQRLVATSLRAMVRAPEAVASLFREAPRTLERWDRTARPDPSLTLAALDAHARIGADDDGTSRRGIRFPSYRSLFRAVAQAVRLDTPFSGDAASDTRALMTALGAGQSFTIVRAFADVLTPIELTATPTGAGVRIRGAVQANLAPAQIETVLLRNGVRVASGLTGVELETGDPAGRYRFLAFLRGTAFPWIVSQAIVAGGPTRADGPTADQMPAAPTPAGPVLSGSAWRIEKDPSSNASLESAAGELRVRFALGTGTPSGQYVAIAAPTGTDPIERISFTGRSDRPMRLSLQVRATGTGGDRRWRRSVYLDENPRQVDVRLADLDPVDRRSSLRPIVAKLQSVLLVVDTVNSRPGTDGTFVVTDVRFWIGTAGARRGPTSGR